MEIGLDSSVKKALSYEEYIVFLQKYTFIDGFRYLIDPTNQQLYCYYHTNELNDTNDTEVKIHLMCKPEYMPIVIDTIITNRDKFMIHSDNPDKHPMFTFKIIPNNYAQEFPLQRFHSTEKNPEELQKQFRPTPYLFNGIAYESELVYPPGIVFYLQSIYLDRYLSILFSLFPDDKTIDYTWPHYYPRFNMKINNIIYVAFTGADDKFNSISCDVSTVPAQCSSVQIHNYLLPQEYKDIQDKCSSLSVDTCNDNAFSRTISDSTLCKWNPKQNQCERSLSLSPHFLLKARGGTIIDYDEDENPIYSEKKRVSIKDMYEHRIKHPELYEAFTSASKMGRKKTRRMSIATQCRKQHIKRKKSSRK